MAVTVDHPDPERDRSELRVELESHLPEALPPGCRAAIFCVGHCFHRHERVVGLELLAGGVPHRAAAAGMPRPDVYRWLHGTAADPDGRSYRSGFWGIVPVRAPEVGETLELSAAAQLADGTRCVRPLGQIAVAVPDPPATPAGQLAPDSIAICMATFDPDPALLRPQLDSLRAQTDQRWICLISDGGSAPKRLEALLDAVGDDRRFVVSPSERRLGPYHNFERALGMVPPTAELVALCDQDDRWYPDKLARLRAAIGPAELVYSDQRLVTADGHVLRGSLWEGRRNDHGNLASMLVANAVPGAAMLFRRRLLGLALPFPDAPGIQYHDHWLALVALSAGELRYIDEPLFDWVQHAGAVSGGAQTSPRRPGSRGWRAAYFGGFVPRQVQAQTLLLRCGALLSAGKRRALERFLGAADSPLCFLWLALRPLRSLAGHDETLWGEAALVRGILWRWLIALAVGRSEQPVRRAYDATFPDPPQFEQRRLRRWRTGS